MLALKDGNDDYDYGEDRIKSNCQKVYCYMGLAILSKAKMEVLSLSIETYI